MLGLQFECPSSGKNAWLTILTFDLLINDCDFACSAHCFNAKHSSSSVYFWGHQAQLKVKIKNGGIVGNIL